MPPLQIRIQIGAPRRQFHGLDSDCLQDSIECRAEFCISIVQQIPAAAQKADLGKALPRMRVDGGASANDVLMQYQSDVSDLVVERPTDLESTARGAAMLAGIGVGLFQGGEEASQMSKIKDKFLPQMAAAARRERLEGWSAAVSRARSPGAS